MEGSQALSLGGGGGLAKGDSVRVPRQDRTRQAQTLLPNGYIRRTMRKDVFAVDQLDSWTVENCKVFKDFHLTTTGET